MYDAGWVAKDVDFVSAHATGTANNDRVEWSAIERELGAPGRTLVVSGSKGHIGHTQGAAGVLELILALICHREGCVPPTLHFRGPRPGCPTDPVAQTTPRAMVTSKAMKLSAAFGGANAVLAYAPGALPPPRPVRARSPVGVIGAGVVGPCGALRLPNLLDLDKRRNVGPCHEVDLDALGVDARRLDRSSRWLTAAAALALSHECRPEKLDRTGFFVAATRMPEQSSRRCMESIRQRGVAGTSASAFARMSVNAPTGACAQALGLLGPTSTFSMGEGSGLLAVALAAEWLAWREDAESIIAGGVDEPSGRIADEAEGAACLMLKRANHSDAFAIEVAGWAIASPNDLAGAIERAMGSRTSVDACIGDVPKPVAPALRRWLSPGSDLGALFADRFWGMADATRTAVMAAVGAAHIAAGCRSVLLVSAQGAASVAVLFEARRAR
jgi:3-oxoacyl-[acyl-carrier-protein] synthase II